MMDGGKVVLRYLCAACMERYLARRPSVIVNVIFAVIIGTRPVRRGRRSQSLGYVRVVAVEVIPVASRGSAADLDNNLEPELH